MGMHPIGYVARETGVSIVINAMLSAGFFFLLFRTTDPVPVWGPSGLAFDMIPHSFMVALMGSLVPGLLARRHAAGTSVWSVARLALLMAVTSVLLGGGAVALLLALSGVSSIGFTTGLIAKTGYGAGLAALVTPLALRRILK